MDKLEYMPTDYSKGKIYTIKCKTDDTKIYVGSTTQTLLRRFSNHKKDSKTVNNKLYKEINNNWNNWYIELYQDFPCNYKNKLLKYEGEIIKLIGTLNDRIAGRTKKECYNDNAEIIKEKTKQYRINNVEKIKEYNKQYRIDNAKKFNEYNKQYRLKKKLEKLTLKTE